MYLIVPRKPNCRIWNYKTSNIHTITSNILIVMGTINAVPAGTQAPKWAHNIFVCALYVRVVPKKNRYKNPTLKQTPSNVPVKNPTNSQGPSNKTTSNSNLRNNTRRKKVLKSLITLETISYKYNSPLDIIKVRDKAFWAEVGKMSGYC